MTRCWFHVMHMCITQYNAIQYNTSFYFQSDVQERQRDQRQWCRYQFALLQSVWQKEQEQNMNNLVNKFQTHWYTIVYSTLFQSNIHPPTLLVETLPDPWWGAVVVWVCDDVCCGGIQHFCRKPQKLYV